MKNIKFIILILLAVSFNSCEEYLDVNTDPNKSSSAEAGPIFTNVIVGYSTNRVIDLGPAVSTAAQLWSGGGSLGAGVFTNPERYTFSIFTTGNTWRSYYRDAIKDLRLAAKNAEAAGQKNAIAQCEIFSALVFYSATVLWGDVPFSEAVDVDFDNVAINNLNPVFDPQKDVLNGVIGILDDAIADIDSNPTSITNNDLIYGGDMTKWRKFAKSLKFRVLMTLVDQEPARASEIATMIAEGDMISSASENAEFPFYTDPGNRNPFWGTLDTFAGGSNFFYFASKAMVDIMKAKNDPRLTVYFTPYPAATASDPQTPTGAPAGVSNIGFNPWVLSTGGLSNTGNELVRPDASDVLFSVEEQLLMEAEAIARGLAAGTLSAADAKLRAGITAAMNRYGISSADIKTYLDNEIPDLSTQTQEQARQIIAEQEWIINVIRPIEGWTTWRRTEVPALSLPDGANTTGLIRRLPYPPDELSANTNAPTGKELDVKMYFDK